MADANPNSIAPNDGAPVVTRSKAKAKAPAKEKGTKPVVIKMSSGITRTRR